ncbi:MULTISPECIES: STAS domain-containing protein [unclassified Streptomyces]|uniref:STAS domain-containing protein n=1 Tax=unclassified Streptomyces TaxID=2593676 RepID=UPI0006AF7689|nr:MULTISPECIES: STAS domain-containing protein [unclassified Streptomyces]
MTTPLLTVTRHAHSSGTGVVKVEGELDQHTSPRLTEALEGVHLTAGTTLVVDLSGLMYCDSTGLTVLIGLHQRTEAAGAPLVLAGLENELLRIFRVTGLDRLFTLRTTVEEALTS